MPLFDLKRQHWLYYLPLYHRKSWFTKLRGQPESINNRMHVQSTWPLDGEVEYSHVKQDLAPDSGLWEIQIQLTFLYLKQCANAASEQHLTTTALTALMISSMNMNDWDSRCNTVTKHAVTSNLRPNSILSSDNMEWRADTSSKDYAYAAQRDKSPQVMKT